MRSRAAAALLAASILSVIPAVAQELAIPEAVYPALPKTAASAEGFVPPGWALESQASGDLNGDGVPDLAFVLRGKDPKNVVPNESGLGENPLDTNPRILAAAFGATSGGYTLALENRTLIPRRTDPVMADPLEDGGISIERGALKVRLHLFMSAGGWGMSTATYTFRHRDGRFALIGYDREEVQRNSGETRSVSINYAMGKMKTETGSIEKDAKKVRWKTLPRRPAPTIDSIGDGLEFDPER
ncbi:MAG TPA: hypothetical protein VF744_15215 [Beijerinckiaceae bacterium]|jgi:hypothetical protein